MNLKELIRDQGLFEITNWSDLEDKEITEDTMFEMLITVTVGVKTHTKSVTIEPCAQWPETLRMDVDHFSKHFKERAIDFSLNQIATWY